VAAEDADIASLLAPPSIEPEPPLEADAARRPDKPPPRRYEGRGHRGSELAAPRPHHEERESASARQRDLEASKRFVEMVAPLLDPAARERALDVRIRVGDLRS
jgi:hypothetical protein